MTPVLDRETSAVMDAMGIKSSTAPETGGGGETKAGTTATNSQTTTTVTSTEKKEGADKVIEIITPTQTKEVKQPEIKDQKPGEVKTEVDVVKLISETLGDTPDNIKTRLARNKELEDLVKKSPYKSQFGEVFDDLVSKNIAPDVALRFMTSDKEKMSHKEVMAFAMQQERPGMGMDKIVEVIDQKYKLGKYAEDGNEAPGLAMLEFDVQPHLQDFDKLKQKLLQNGQSRESIETGKQETARIEAWKEPTKQIFEQFTKIEIPTPAGATLRYNVKMDDAERNELVTEFGRMISAPGFVADEAGIAKAKNALQARYVAKHINDLAISFMNQGRSMSNEDWIKLVHNPSMSNTKGQTEFDKKGDRDDNIAQMIIQAEGPKGK